MTGTCKKASGWHCAHEKSHKQERKLNISDTFLHVCSCHHMPIPYVIFSFPASCPTSLRVFFIPSAVFFLSFCVLPRLATFPEALPSQTEHSRIFASSSSSLFPISFSSWLEASMSQKMWFLTPTFLKYFVFFVATYLLGDP